MGNLIVILVLTVAVALISRSIYNKKKAARLSGGCTGNCASCSCCGNYPTKK